MILKSVKKELHRAPNIEVEDTIKSLILDKIPYMIEFYLEDIFLKVEDLIYEIEISRK